LTFDQASNRCDSLNACDFHVARPLRTARAAFTAGSSSKPDGGAGCSCWERVQVPSPRRREDPLPQPPYVVRMRAPVDGAPHQDVDRRSVHREVSNLPSDSDGLTSIRFTAHLPTSAPLSGPGHSWPGIRPVTQQRPPGGAATIVVVSCRLSPTGIRFLSILFPPEDSAIPYGWPTAPPQRSGLCRGSRVPHV
jgi:hypothetical protein